MKKRLKIYKSFEEQEADQIAYQLSISPAQRIKEAVELIKKIYNYSDDQKIDWKLRILR
ncbi:MAG TPA: hypothetical protein VEB40_03090 [Flavipsychrobacter sp.]|nr:hypothetical protein [Flavipsychrobacter sp.]